MLKQEQVKSFLNKLPTWGAFVDTNMRFVAINQRYADNFGFFNIQIAHGSSLYDIPCAVRECATYYQQHYLKVMQSRQKSYVLDIVLLPDDHWHTYWTIIDVVVDSNDTVVGVICYGIECLALIAFQLLSVLASLANKTIDACYLKRSLRIWLLNNKPLRLSSCERDILFCLSRGKNAQQTATILSISADMVSTHIQALQQKFHVNNPQALLEQAILHNQLATLPQHRLRQQYSIGISIPLK